MGIFTDNADNVDDVQTVIELKTLDIDLDLRQNRKNDRRTPVEQAFSYAHKFSKVRWVIVSNYNSIRLYPNQSSKYYLDFDLTTITNPDQISQLKLFFLLLSQENMLADGTKPSTTQQIFARREQELTDITAQFYNDYKIVREKTAREILNQSNHTVDHSVALAQTILDRIIFIAFLESFHLIPQGTIKKAYETRE